MSRRSIARFFREFCHWRNLLVVGVLIALSFGLERLWILQYPGVLLMQAVDRERTPALAQEVVLVTITHDEYQKKFANTSPLNARLLMQAIDNILVLRPRLLAVDLDTSDPSFAVLRKNHLNDKLVWARGVVFSDDKLKAAGFLSEDRGDSPFAGIAGFERDPDATVRKLQGCITLEGTRMRTFHRAIFLAATNPESPLCVEQELPANLYRFPTLTLTEVEEAAKHGGVKGDNLLTGKIVLLGGLYSIADYHPGPNGSIIPGIELVASAVEAQMESKEPHELLQIFVSILAELLLAILIASIYELGWPLAAKLFASLTVAGVFLFLPGVLLYWFQIWSLNPFILVFGMIMHQMYEAAREHSEGGHPLEGSRVVSVLREEKIHVQYSSPPEK